VELLANSGVPKMSNRRKKKAKKKTRTNRARRGHPDGGLVQATEEGRLNRFVRPPVEDAFSHLTVDLDEFMVELDKVPYLSPPDGEALAALIAAQMRYERYVARGRREEDVDPENWPPDFGRPDLFADIQAYEFYRHSLYAWTDRAMRSRSWVLVIRGLIERALARHPDACKQFSAALLSEPPEHALAQLHNQWQEYAEGVPPGDPEAELRRALNWYCSFFEVDAALWFIGCLGHLLNGGGFRAKRYGGMVSGTDQGSFVNAVLEDCAASPLADAVEAAYDKDFRNAHSHSDYRIEGTNADGLGVVSVKSGERWEPARLHELISTAFGLLQAVLYGMAYLRHMVPARQEDHLNDRGIVEISLFPSTDRFPTLLVFQLWCFWELDPMGHWLDGTSLEFARLPNGEAHVLFSDHACISGPVVPEFEQLVKAQDWIHVIRVPVAPYLHAGGPVTRFPSGVVREVVAVPDTHFVPAVTHDEVVVKSCWHATVATWGGI
jgi:hypothetical protein